MIVFHGSATIMVPAFTPPKALSLQKNGPAQRTRMDSPTAMN